jgi:hypothetical protein
VSTPLPQRQRRAPRPRPPRHPPAGSGGLRQHPNQPALGLRGLRISAAAASGEDCY